MVGNGREHCGMYYCNQGNKSCYKENLDFNVVCFLPKTIRYSRLGYTSNQVLDFLTNPLGINGDFLDVCYVLPKAKETRDSFPLSSHVYSSLRGCLFFL